MAKVVWTDEAAEQLDQITAYIELFDLVAADKIGTALRALGESLTDFPRQGRLTDGGQREMVNLRPYILKYEAREHRVFIRLIRHNARDMR